MSCKRSDLVELAQIFGVNVKRDPPKRGNKNMKELREDITLAISGRRKLPVTEDVIDRAMKQLKHEVRTSSSRKVRAKKRSSREPSVPFGTMEVRCKHPVPPTVICIKKKYLNSRGYRDLEHWLENPNHVYIGRDMTFYVKGAARSKWHNPFTAKRYGRAECLRLYEARIRENINGLWDQLGELSGKVLGCWCKPEPCHGDVLTELFREKYNLLGR